MTRGRKTKYTSALAQKIFDAIADSGSHRAAWESAEIHHSTFYDWRKKYPEFSAGIAKAEEIFRQKLDNDFVDLANQRLREVLEKGVTIRWKKSETRTREVICPDSGSVLRVIRETVDSTSEEFRGVPSWAIERALPKPIRDLDDLAAIAAEFGCAVVVKDFQLFKDYLRANTPDLPGKKGVGLSSETTARIRSEILGIDKNEAVPSDS